MAKFKYSMQNILNIKYKLEENAKQEYADALHILQVEEDKLKALEVRLQGYIDDYNKAIKGKLDFIKIDGIGNAVDIIKEYIGVQEAVVRQKNKEVDLARLKLTEAMKERKMHEKLRENQFELFKKELNAQEANEIDEVVSYNYNSSI